MVWKENVPYLCRAMMSSAWLAAVVLIWGWFCWLMTSARELALNSGKKGGHWTLFTHTRFQFTPTSYLFLSSPDVFSLAVLSKLQPSNHAQNIISFCLIVAQSSSTTTPRIHRHMHTHTHTHTSANTLSVSIFHFLFKFLPSKLPKLAFLILWPSGLICNRISC